MRIANRFGWAFAAIMVVALSPVARSQQKAAQVSVDADDIGGVVTSSNGPEAGVWVIAETNDFQTKYAKIVVTDDRGRYLVPALPEAHYMLWVRGYGLVDSAKVPARRGTLVNLTAVVAPDAAAAAKVYPAIAWFAMMHLPNQSEVNAIPGGMNRYLSTMKNDACVGCHQLGDAYTRTIPAALGTFPNSQQAWIRRLQSGQAGLQMTELAASVLNGLPYKYLSEWSDRIAAGELPSWKPPRPTGRERDLVVTVRDWSDPKAYLHDLTSTDWRHPTVNGYGPVYGSPELSTDEFPILDPVKNVATTFHVPVRDADTPVAAGPVFQPSPVWGNERIWTSRANSHNPIMDEKGRVWYTAVIRAANNEPAFCKKGSDNPSAQLFPLSSSGREVGMYDPKTKKYTFVDTCFSTHHLRFADGPSDILWFSNDRNNKIAGAIGWLNTKMFDETGNADKSQGWTALILDTNGNGKRDAYVEPDQPVNPKMDKRIDADFYAIMPDPTDPNVVWGASRTYPFRPEQVGAVVRLSLGPNPPATTLAEVYNVPAPGFGVRGADIDSHGVVWVSLGSGHMGAFDRRKCKGPLIGPKATGDQCPEGWTFYRFPGPGFPELPQYSAESSYYTWVDRYNTLGLGKDVPIATGNLFDGVHALVNGKFVTLRVPYPLGFFTKGFEGRIDDPKAGWKGRGLWIPEGDRTPWHHEGGKGNKPLVLHMQMRHNPLAK